MISADQLEVGDILCVGGQIGAFVDLFGKKKDVCYRPFGGESTRLAYPGTEYVDERRGVRVERGQRWVRVTKAESKSKRRKTT